MIFRKNEYSTLDAAIEAAQRFWAEIICNTRVKLLQSGDIQASELLQASLQRYDVLAIPVMGAVAGPAEEEYPSFVDGQAIDDYVDWLRFFHLRYAHQYLAHLFRAQLRFLGLR